MSGIVFLTLGALLGSTRSRAVECTYILAVAAFMTLPVGPSRVALGVRPRTDRPGRVAQCGLRDVGFDAADIEGDSMKSTLAIPAAVTLALGPGLVHGQYGQMMNGGGWYGGWMGDGYGGVWIPILLVVIAGLLAWIVMKRRK